MTTAGAADTRHSVRTGVILGVMAGLLAASSSGRLALIGCVAVLAALAAWWLIQVPTRWVAVFLCAAILLPPLPIPLGDSGPHVAAGIALAGAFVSILYLQRWRIEWSLLHVVAVCFFGCLTASLAMALLYSGPEVAFRSLLRVILGGLSLFVFLFETWGPAAELRTRPEHLARVLFYAGVAAAAFACLDFYFQWPPVAGFGPQFIWLDAGVFRRAQGLFYEASTLGNMCAFFLVMIAVALIPRAAPTPVPRVALAFGAVPLAAALVLSFSRASLVNLAVALAVLVLVHRQRIRWSRVLTILVPTATLGGLLLWRYAATFVEAYWLRWLASGANMFSATGLVLSGRLESWSTLTRFVTEQPAVLLLGIGYKTLPYTSVAGRPVVADNMYLSVLVETGVLGLAALIALNVAILRSAWRGAHSTDATRAFFAQWILAFWAGESIQMMSGDLLTYWRVLPLYFWVLAIAVRR